MKMSGVVYQAVSNKLWSLYNLYNSTIWFFASNGQDERANAYRSTLWPDVHGKILELGPGFSSSLKLLPHKTMNDGAYSVDPTVVESYTTLEPNPFMYGGLQKNAEDNGFCVKYDGETYPDGKGTPVKDYQDLVPFHIVRGTLDDEAQVPTSVLANAPYDTIITSFSLCTARNPQESIRNIVRLLKPSGMYIFIEHIRHPPVGDPLVLEDNGVDGRFWGAMQGIVNPLWRILGHGCEVNRHTAQTIDSTSGWESVEYKYVRIGGDILSYFLPMTFGKAIKARE